MVFYKDLNERFISENPANTVSERSGSPLSPGSPFVWPGSGPIQAVVPSSPGHKPSTDDAPRGARSCPSRCFYPRPLSNPSVPSPVLG